METLYYSNFCKHSQGILNFLVKSNLAENINFLCIDKRRKENQQVMIVLENGKTIPMPPHIHSVPALTKNGINVVYGEDILQYFKKIPSPPIVIVEPIGVSLQDTQSIVSEAYTFYNLNTDELSAKGTGGRRQMYNYISANHTSIGTTIPTPPETYRPDKVSKDVTIDSLNNQRNNELFVPKV